MRRKSTIVVFAAILFAPAVLWAQDSMPRAGEARSGSDSNTQYKETTTYDFEADDVTGNLVKPDGANIQGQQHGKTSSLIDIRSDFVPEMMKTVENL